MLRRARRVQQDPAPIIPLEDDAERVAALVVKARKLLVPVAELHKKGKKLQDLPASGYFALGGENGVGTYIRIANVPLDARGRVSDTALTAFYSEVQQMREDLVAVFTSACVTLSLMLTIFAVLALAEASGYLLAAQAVNDDNQITPTVWGPDAAAFLAPGNEAAVRRAFYATEYAILAVALIGGISGLIFCQVLLFLLMALPTKLAVLDFVLDRTAGASSIIIMYICTDIVLFALPLCLPFIAARVSAMAFFGSCVVWLLSGFLVWFKVMGGPAKTANRILIGEAYAAVHRSPEKKADETETAVVSCMVTQLSASEAP